MDQSAQIPAVCDRCGQVFASGIALGLGAGATVISSKAGPCPRCGGWGSIPNGTYQFAQEAERVVELWTPYERESLANELRTAVRTKERRVAEQALRNRAGLRELAERLLIPRDAAAFWGLVAVLLMVIGMVGNKDGDINVNVTEQHSTTINVSPPKPPVSTNAKGHGAAPPPPKKKRAQAKKKARQKKR